MAAHRALLVAFALACIPGCGDGTDDVIVVDPVGDTTNEGFARGDEIANLTAAELAGDPYTVVIGKTATILAVMNDGIIAQSDFAAQVVLFGDIFDYANLEIIDHDDANLALDDVVRFYGVNFVVSSSADALADEYSAGFASLRGAPPDDVDFAYVELQVLNHAQALVLLDELQAQVGPGVMGDYIADTRVMMNDHLALSQSLMATFF
jgi:hypothetical protein